MNMQRRNSQVISVSLEPQVAKMLDSYLNRTGQIRSRAIAQMIKRVVMYDRLENLREYGRKSAIKLGIKTEEDVYRIMGEV